MNTPTDDDRRTRDPSAHGDGTHDESFAGRARELFDDSVERLDASTLSKLNQARHAALAASSKPATNRLRWMPATGLAAAAVVAVIMLQGRAGIDIPGDADDFEILLGQDDLEMIEELEFYSWMELADLDVADDVG